MNKEAITKLVQCLSEKKEAQERGQDPRPLNRNVLRTVANRIVKDASTQGSGRGLTLVFQHGAGAHKEAWEPTLRRLLNSTLSSRPGPQIEEIWVLDCTQHGDSAFLNENLLGDTFDCVDHSRDLLNFVFAYLPSNIHAKGVPTNLHRLSEIETHNRKEHGFKSPTIVGVGHSIGTCSFIYPAVLSPSALSSLVLVESFTTPEYLEHLDSHRKNEAACLRRKWTWNSRDAAMQDIRASSYYQSWHSEILHEYFHHAIREINGGSDFCATLPEMGQEAMMLFERANPYETWQMLADIDPNMPLHWIWGGKSKRGGGADVQTQTTFRHPGLNSNVWHLEIDHMLLQEAPDLLADDICQFLKVQYPSTLQTKL